MPKLLGFTDEPRPGANALPCLQAHTGQINLHSLMLSRLAKPMDFAWKRSHSTSLKTGWASARNLRGGFQLIKQIL